jgi:hypothetical protein
MLNDNILSFLIFLAIILHIVKNNTERFTNSNNCTPENDCFPNNYARTQEYTNVCPPEDTRLSREPIWLKQNCTKRLGNFGINYNQ